MPHRPGAPRATRMRASRAASRPLEGLRATIKDCFEVAGMVTSAGALALQNYIPKEGASAVARLRRAGAILLGKTNVPIFTGDFQAYNCIYGTSNNPWKQDFSPGVSSGGAAAAIATGMSALELGSDLVGSIRWPLHCCGIFRPENDVERCLDLWAYPADARGAPRTQSRAPCRGPARPLGRRPCSRPRRLCRAAGPFDASGGSRFIP